MLGTIKAEFRKLISVRSTYIVTALALALVTFFAFYAEGLRADPASLLSPSKLAGEVTGAIQAVAVIGALVGVLIMAHEYRYSTIIYTLTTPRSRSRVLLAKIIVVSGYALAFTLAVAVWSPLMTALGIHFKHFQLVHQVLPYRDLAWRVLLFGWGYSMMGLMLTVLFRNMAASIAAIFLAPGTIEPLIGLLFKGRHLYLPFNALSSLVEDGTSKSALSHGTAALVFLAYLVAGWLITFAVFAKRDAN